MESSETASYWRVFNGLLDQIRGGIYQPGARLPSAPALAEQLGVSRATVTRAMERLRWIGLVVGPRGGVARVASGPRRAAALAIVDEADRVRAMPE